MPDGSNYGSDSTQALLSERGKTHGDFSDHARITQRLKEIVADELTIRWAQRPKQQPLSLAQRESVDMILHKIGRVIAGNADYKDHWDDIAGYAKLVADRCPENVTNVPVAPVRIVPRRPLTLSDAIRHESAPVKVAWGHEDPGDAP